MNLTIIKKRSRLGFTLVELIVVIAILAILAGIAIPIYSNYINKANKAADLMLLDAANTAFGAACLENGVNPRGLSTASLTVGEKKITGATAAGADINASFLKYFGDNKNTELKVINSFDYDKDNGVFTPAGEGGSGGEGGSTTSLGDIVAGMKDQILSAIAGSSFSGSEQELLSDMQSLTNAARSIGQNSEANLDGMLGGAFGNYLTANGWRDEEGNVDAQTMANAASLMVAEQIDGLSDDASQALIDSWATNFFSRTQGGLGIATRYSRGGNGAEPVDGVTTLGSVATAYANTEALIQYLNKNDALSGNEKLAAMNSLFSSFPNTIKSATSSQDVIDAMNNLADSINDTLGTDSASIAVKQAIQSYVYGTVPGTDKSQARLDAEAYVATLQILSQNSENLKEYVGEADLFTTISGFLG